MSRSSLWSVLLLTVTLALRAEGPARLDPWPMDVVHLKNGHQLLGLIEEETPSLIKFHNVRRAPGRPTVVLATTLPRSEVARVDALDPPRRDRLRQLLKELDSNGKLSEERLGRVELRPAPWNGRPGGLQYTSDQFTLISNAPEAVVRRSVILLEQIYTAYARFLPARHTGGTPTTVLLVASLDEYRRLGNGPRVMNPAYFDPAINRIVCASDLERLGNELEAARQENLKARRLLDQQEADLRQTFPAKELPRFLEPIQRQRRQILEAERKNERLFDKATQRLFATLYHEAFHAYLNGFVYPPEKGELPRWLNEGLAQIFETAIVEAGELRVGHADAERLDLVRKALRMPPGLVPIADLLSADAKQFLVFDAGNRSAAHRTYLTCWAVAFHLTFERRLLGSKAMDHYVAALKQGMPPRKAFETLVGQSLETYQQELTTYLSQLQSDGSPAALPKK